MAEVDDVVAACIYLAERAGALEAEIGFTDEDAERSEDARWYGMATWRGFRIMVQDHRSPSAAALDLAQKILTGAACKCRRPIVLSDGHAGCRWRLVGDRWQSGCTAPAIQIPGDAPRGDTRAIHSAFHRHQPG